MKTALARIAVALALLLPGSRFAPAGEAPPAGMYVGYSEPVDMFDYPQTIMLVFTAEPRGANFQINGDFYSCRKMEWISIGKVKGIYRTGTGQFKGTKDIQDQPEQNIDGKFAGGVFQIDRYECFQIPNLDGAYLVEGEPDRKAGITQKGAFLKVNFGPEGIAEGVFLSGDSLVARIKKIVRVGNIKDEGKTISWTHAVTWKKQLGAGGDVPDISGTWYREGLGNKPCRVEQTGGEITFVNEVGHRSPGRFLDYGTVFADYYSVGGLQGKYDAYVKKIEWENGWVWSKNLPAAYALEKTELDLNNLRQSNSGFDITEKCYTQERKDDQGKVVKYSFRITRPPPDKITPGENFTISLEGEIENADCDYAVNVYWRSDQGNTYYGLDYFRGGSTRIGLNSETKKVAPVCRADIEVTVPSRLGGDRLTLVFAVGHGLGTEPSYRSWIDYIYKK